VRADLQAIVSACERASLELLQSLRVTGQNITLKESVDFGQLAASELELYRSKVSDSVHFIVDVHASLPKLRADRAAIRQLMTQLIALAVQDLDQREGEVLVVLRPFNASFDQEPPGALIEGIAPQGSFLELTVIDDGAGTMLAKLKDAFDPVKSLSQSADINLAVVRGTVRAHRGLIYAETAPKHGMRITVLFPIEAEHA
jgi:signal transduction histidine kinase